MESNNTSSGPIPSTLENVDHVPVGVEPIPLTVTYSSGSVTDYMAIRWSDRQVILDLAEPLFGIVRKVGSVSDFVTKLRDALTTIGIGSVVEYFTSLIADYANLLLPAPVVSTSIGLGTAASVLKILYDQGLLKLGVIHQASIDEIPRWEGLVEQAKEDPDIDVT